jgi:hypothetical protein
MSKSSLKSQKASRLCFTGLLLLIAAPITMETQQPTSSSTTSADVMVVAIGRNDSVLAGGISTGKIKPHAEVDVEPLAWLSSSGEWRGFRCDEDHPKACGAFESEYLKKPHTYGVVSADGRGATVKVQHMELDHECFGYGGQGTYSGAPITYATVAASSPDIFTVGGSAKRLTARGASAGS